MGILAGVGRVRIGILVAAALTASALLTPAAGSASTARAFKIPCCASLEGITAGPDEALWFTEPGKNAIGRITTSGAISSFALPSSSAGPGGIAKGPDGRLWFTETQVDQIGAITTGGAVTEYPVPGDAGCEGYECGVQVPIAAGPDGRLWFQAGQDQIGAIGTDGTVTDYPVPQVPAGDALEVTGIAAGPDGRIWFTAGIVDPEDVLVTPDHVGAITTTGTTTLYSIPAGALAYYPGGIGAGPDGRMWFGDRTLEGIGAITTAGDIQVYGSSCAKGNGCGQATPGNAIAITAGPDGRVWFSDTGNLFAATTSGSFTPISLPTGPSCSAASLPGIAAGPGGGIWTTEVWGYCEDGAEDGDDIVAVTPGGSGVASAASRCTVPSLTGKTLAAARAVLLARHCTLGEVTHEKAAGKSGRVLSQKPKPGSTLKAGAEVRVVVSRGKSTSVRKRHRRIVTKRHK